ncbi:family 10 glycosylhydrolase [Gracilimonas tropica]|uniref:family 10 glycosylhydrolase n=1 Tax=Gracilimonas tropica TaxID=454600 RepID=UPI0003764BFA|nr:family 10 glycosylhydrolase [Gracilimonas tropica]
MRLKIFYTVILLLFCSSLIQAQEPPKKEFRGVWIATVINLDWPESSSWSVDLKKKDLIKKLNALKNAGVNVVFFQIRTEGDALYDSDIEPWSKYLTGDEGTPPDPYWDPLEFAIEEAHKRGMELHAWLNPYRAMRMIPDDFTQKIQNADIDESLKPFLAKEYDENSKAKGNGTSERDSMHISNTHPEWLLVLNDAIAIFDPGLPEVMEYNVNVVMDVVNRYDIDGIHFDDYFYPYPPNHMGSSEENEALDDSTFAQYPRGFENKDDWRRNNINLFIEMVHDSITVMKPWVKFGISPFGIWKPGTPGGTTGLNAFATIYADGVAWLEAQSIDYITPQLYWPFGGGQDYGLLSNWWAARATENDRHIYPGHGLYRTDGTTFSGSLFAANEIPRQVRHNRNNENINGSVFFRAKNITTYSSKGFADSLKNNLYKYAALQPTMSWKDTTKPESPQNLVVNRDSEVEYKFHLSWDAPNNAPVAKRSNTGHVDSLIKYAIYRVDASQDPNEMEEMEKYYNLIEVTGETSYTDITPPSENGYWYFVTAVSRNNVESDPTGSVEAGVVVSNETLTELPESMSLEQNYPNPFNPTTQIKFTLSESGFATLKVYDMLGREVATLKNEVLSSGQHSVNFNASDLSSGIYIYQLTMGSETKTRKMTLIK